MKKNFTLLLIGGAFLTLLFTSCEKSYRDINGYWYSQQQGQVVFSDPSCAFVAVETSYGYSILRLYDSYTPYLQSSLYGNFESYGTRRFYDDASGVEFSAEVMDYDLSYNGAQDAINYYCPDKAGKAIMRDSTGNKK